MMNEMTDFKRSSVFFEYGEQRPTYDGNVIAELARNAAVGVLEEGIIGCSDAQDNNGKNNCRQSQEPKPGKRARRCLICRINLKLGKSHCQERYEERTVEVLSSTSNSRNKTTRRREHEDQGPFIVTQSITRLR